MNVSTEHAGAVVARLAERFDGRLITPEHPEYDAARTVFSGRIDRRPAAIVRPADTDQVAQVVTVARDSGIDLAVRSGGHSGAGHSVVDGGVVLDLSDMKALEIDVEGRTAWAQTGLTAGEYTAAVAEHGLATGFGDTGSVGIGGITLGGGAGYLSRKYGLTIDDVLAAEIVTADGQIRQVDAETEPDLFWAIRGGGGNFGVVTRFKYRLHEVDTAVGGMLFLPATPEIIRSAVAESESAPEELSAIINVMTAPPMPFIPAEYHGKLIIMALICYAGPAEAGEKAIAPFRALAEPIADMIKPIRYPEMYPPDQEGYRPTAAGTTLFMDTVSADAAELIVNRLRESTAAMSVVQLRVLGGAVARVPADATAYAHRNRRIMANVAAMYQQPEDAGTYDAWVAEVAAELRDGGSEAYVNFVNDEGPERVRDAYPGATWDRLRDIKRRYDPGNLFRLNQNIPPADSPVR